MSTTFQPRLLRSGWWQCVCERSCRCGGSSQQLQRPEIARCEKCGIDKPTEITDPRIRPRPHPGRS